MKNRDTPTRGRIAASELMCATIERAIATRPTAAAVAAAAAAREPHGESDEAPYDEFEIHRCSVQAGVVAIVVLLLQFCRDDETVQRCCTRTLAMIIQYNGSHAEVGTSGAVSPFIKLLHSPQPETSANAATVRCRVVWYR